MENKMETQILIEQPRSIDELWLCVCAQRIVRTIVTKEKRIRFYWFM